MDNEMRERLVEVIGSVCNRDGIANHCPQRIADALIADGWIRLPLIQEINTSEFNEQAKMFDKPSSFWEVVYLKEGVLTWDIYVTESEARAALEMEGKR